MKLSNVSRAGENMEASAQEAIIMSEVLWEFVGKKCYMLFWNEMDKDELCEKSMESKHLQLPLKRTASSLIHWEMCYRSSKLTREHCFLLLFFCFI